ncbi:hypothetical protein PAMC26510_16590 [Caballeronia sordidicola]|uniref:Uncharacterized protein n=1 Tax=Caballeronia sordidicola TaxID=196367 RepID=A0A242MT64_CABSO|nr:hypothetical protein PAMC26510_16590 [Caballeronia sordidicola]
MRHRSPIPSRAAIGATAKFIVITLSVCFLQSRTPFVMKQPAARFK